MARFSLIGLLAFLQSHALVSVLDCTDVESESWSMANRCWISR